MINPIEITRRKLNTATHRIYTLPILILMPHSSCNCRCVMCDIWLANQNRQEISPEALARHARDLQKFNVQWVVLSGGEALMHRNLWALCKILKESGMKITLLSTGLLLKRHAQEIVRWCDELILSLDGSQPVHDQIRRVPNGFKRLSQGIRAVRELAPSFRITGRCVLQRLNYRDLPNIILAAKEIGLNEISFLAADISTEAFNRPEPWEESRKGEVALNRMEAEEFQEILDRVIQEFAVDFTSGFIVESPQKLRELAQYYRALHRQVPFPAVRCNAPWVSAVIEADGNVRPCFFHPVIGNIHEAPFSDVINSRPAVTFRESLKVSEDPVCKRCVCSLYLGARSDIDS